LWRSFGRRLWLWLGGRGLNHILHSEGLGLKLCLEESIEIGHVAEGSANCYLVRKPGGRNGLFSFEAPVAREVSLDTKGDGILSATKDIIKDACNPAIRIGNRDPLWSFNGHLNEKPHLYVEKKTSIKVARFQLQWVVHR
jgi:hypothetical protein